MRLSGQLHIYSVLCLPLEYFSVLFASLDENTAGIVIDLINVHNISAILMSLLPYNLTDKL